MFKLDFLGLLASTFALAPKQVQYYLVEISLAPGGIMACPNTQPDCIRTSQVPTCPRTAFLQRNTRRGGVWM